MAIPMPSFEDVNFEFQASSGASGGTNVFQSPGTPQWQAGTSQNKNWLFGTATTGQPAAVSIPSIGGINPLLLLAGVGAVVWLVVRGRK